MRRILKAVLIGLIVILIAGISGAIWARRELTASLPQLDGTRELAGLSAPVTVTRDVPSGGVLVVSRVPQRHVDGWVARRRRAAAGTKAKSTATSAAPRRARKPARSRARRRR